MAKSSLDLSGCKASKIELDLFKLMFAIKNIQENKNNVQGFFLVYNNEIKNYIENKIHKYKFDKNLIKVLTFIEDEELNKEHFAKLYEEKLLNSNFKNSLAKVGKNYIEYLLKTKILEIYNQNEMSKIEENISYQNIDWDYSTKITLSKILV